MKQDTEQALLLQAGEAYKEIARQAEEALRELQRQADEAQELIERAGLWKPE